MIRQFFKFILLVIWRLKDPVFLVFDFFTLIFWIISRQMPIDSVPITISLALILLYISCFAVWRDELNKNRKLTNRLDEMKNKEPVFKVNINGLTSFSIKSYIEETCADLEKTGRLISAQLSQEMSSIIQHALAQNSSALIASGIFGKSETLEEKHTRLTKHLNVLRDYEKRLEHIYMVDDFIIEGSRSDEDIEITIHSIQVIKMYIDNDYVIKHIPKTSEPKHSFLAGVSLPGPSYVRTQNQPWVAHRGSDSEAYSKIDRLNAQRAISIFPEEFFIEANDDYIDLEIMVHSKKRDASQKIIKRINLTDAKHKDLKNERELH